MAREFVVETGDIAKYPQPMWRMLRWPNYGYQSSTPFHDQSLESADYLRLQNITIGYTLPEHTLAKMKVERIRFYVSGSNQFHSNSFGWDPEIGLNSGSGVSSAGIMFRGDGSELLKQ